MQHQNNDIVYSREPTARPFFRVLLAGLTLLMAVVMAVQGVRWLGSDAAVPLSCSGRRVALCEAAAWLLRHLVPASLHAVVLGVVACAIAVFLAWVTWLVLFRALRPAAGSGPVAAPPPASTAPRRRRVALQLVVLGGLAAGLVLLYSDRAREYRLYLTEDRPSATIDFAALSQDATERDIRAAYPQLRFRCYTNRPGEYLDERSCFADVEALNGAPAMSLSFYYAAGKLNRMSANIPSWAHGDFYRAMLRRHGLPRASQEKPAASVRLHGWALPGGGALFYNRDRPLNPLDFNGVLWVSARQCARQGCLALTPKRQP